jgi:3-oxoacyl-[acyl-carrier protein] reductase
MSRVIVITGTRKGIGKVLSEYYLSQGDIVVGCSRGESDIDNENYFHFSLDVCDEKAVVKMIRTVKRQHKRIDVLLNNAGIASMNHFVTTPYSTVKKIFSTNFFGTFLFSREVSKVMMKQKFGRIVNYTTVATPLRLEGEAIYAASKAAIESMTQTTAKELSEFGITVNAIGPTPVETDLIKAVPKDKIQNLLSQQAIKRFGDIKDICNVIDFFISKKSDFVTGQIIYLGGVNN